MTDREKVTEELQSLRDFLMNKAFNENNNSTVNVLMHYWDVVIDTLALLKEQEPVEPSVDVDTYVCPNCGHRLEHQGMLGDNVIFDERYNFCPACGKAVKWDAAD